MKTLKKYELANVAAWCFDFENASRLFRDAATQSANKKDILGTIGAVEFAALAEEMSGNNWSTAKSKQSEMRNTLFEDNFAIPSGLDDQQRIRFSRFEEYLAGRRETIARTVQRHKKRLLLPKMIPESTRRGREYQVGYLSADPYGNNWFIAVQSLSAFCLGRAYRRDGLVPDLNMLQKQFIAQKFHISDFDERCLQLLFEGFTAEVWFDGRVSIIAPANLHDEVRAALHEIADEYDNLLQSSQ